MRLKEKLSIKRDMSYQAGKVWERVEMENALSRNRRSPARTVSLPLKRSPVSVKTVSHLWTNLTLASVDSPLSPFLVFGPDNRMER